MDAGLERLKKNTTTNRMYRKDHMRVFILYDCHQKLYNVVNEPCDHKYDKLTNSQKIKERA